MDDIVGYLIEPIDLDVLREINICLYNDRPLSGDQRRDLANLMRTIVDRAQAVKASDLA